MQFVIYTYKNVEGSSVPECHVYAGNPPMDEDTARDRADTMKVADSAIGYMVLPLEESASAS